MPGKKSFRILLVDDHIFFRCGIKNHISKNSGLDVVGEVADGGELLPFLAQNPVDMIIMDITMPNVDGFQALGLVKEKYPKIKVLMCSGKEDKSCFLSAMDSGADGYLGKLESEDEVFVAIDKIRAGNYYISPFMVDEFMNDEIANLRSGSNRTAVKITRREREVLGMLVQGFTSNQIAKQFGRSPRTIEHHRYLLLKKCKKKNTAELVHWAVCNGFASSA